MNELMPNPGEKKAAKEKKTVRCQVDISKDREKYTELSWYDLLAKQHKNNRDETNSTDQDKDKPGGGLNPYASDDEDQLKALAAKFDKKYADKPKKKGTKRRVNMEDLADGYDRDDPFIDDSECFDEEVPQEITTALGGFYVNSGLLEFKNNSQAVFEITDSDSDDSGKETKKKKEKKPPPVGGIPILPAKKAKVKHTKARMITTPINSGPKKQKQNSNDIKIIKTKPAQKEIKVLTIIDSPERKEKLQGDSVIKKTEKTAPVNTTNNSSKSSTDKKTTLSIMKAKSESSSGKSSSGTSSPVQLSVAKAATNSSSKAVSGSSSPIIITSGVKATKISSSSPSSPLIKVSTSNTITVKSSSAIVNSGKTPTTTTTSKPTTVAKPSSIGSSSSGSESSSGDKKDLKAERKVKTVAPVGQVGKSSPKPPEFVDLEAQLNDLANACDKSKTEKVKQNLSNALSLSKSSSPQPNPSSTQADNQKSESTSAKTSVLSSVPLKSTNSTKSVPSSGQQASITKYITSTSQGTTTHNQQVSQSISITRVSSSGGTKTVNSTSSSQNNSKSTTYSWTLPEKSSATSPSSAAAAVSISSKPSSVSPHSIASLTSPTVHSTAVVSKTTADPSSRSTQQSTYNQTSPSTVRSANNQQKFIQSPSSNQKQYSQSQASSGNFSHVSAVNQSQAKIQYSNQSGVGDNLMNVSRSGSGNSTYNSSAGNVNQLMTSSSGYSSKPVAAIPGIRQTTTHSQNSTNQGGVTHQTSPNLTGSKKSQQYGRDAIKQMSSTVGATQHQAHMTNTGVDNPGNINVKNVYNDSYYGTHEKSSAMNISSSPSHHHIQTSPSNSMHQQVNTSPRMGGITISPQQGQMTSPRGMVGGMGMMQGGMANQQANNMYQQQLTQQQQYNQMAFNSNIIQQNGVVNQDMRSQFYQIQQLPESEEFFKEESIKSSAQVKKTKPVSKKIKEKACNKPKKITKATKKDKVEKITKNPKAEKPKKKDKKGINDFVETNASAEKVSKKIKPKKEKVVKVVKIKKANVSDKVSKDVSVTTNKKNDSKKQKKVEDKEKIIKNNTEKKPKEASKVTKKDGKVDPKNGAAIKKDKKKTDKGRIALEEKTNYESSLIKLNDETDFKQDKKGVKRKLDDDNQVQKKKPRKTNETKAKENAPNDSKIEIDAAKAEKFKCFYCKELKTKPCRSELYRHYGMKHHMKDLVQYVESNNLSEGTTCKVCGEVKKTKRILMDHMALKHGFVEQFLPMEAKIADNSPIKKGTAK